MDAIIKVENVTKEYKTKHYTVKALDNISWIDGWRPYVDGRICNGGRYRH